MKKGETVAGREKNPNERLWLPLMIEMEKFLLLIVTVVSKHREEEMLTLLITSQLQLCGDTVTEESKLERTFSTFHLSQIVLQQQYRDRRFTRYSELIGVLLLAEQINELLVKNHESRPCGSAPVTEVNETSYSGHGCDSGKRGSCGKKNKRGGRKNKNIRGNPYKTEHGTDAKQAKGKELAVNPSKKTDKSALLSLWS
ncbi:uncharacterized protein LOC113335228 [Papaver somniferum]|uniref:uncharacterized protein LOC113335228 n=1 Tax=Papaver somniferum TaxID=3469 RepID=UPI000E6FD6EB|nr:uncharacterized protein LOC113335228 [Papaver somniferum]